MNPEVIQYVMYYSDPLITMDIYNHIAEMSHMENVLSKMNLHGTVPDAV